ncbi:MAG: SpoIIE family protein phosphatase [Actinoplanes sp.]
MEVDLSWAAALHRLWRAVTGITARDQLAELILPPLQALPGVVAVWGLRHGPDGDVIAYRWAGLPLADSDRQKIADGFAGCPNQTAEAPEPLRELGAEHVVTASFGVPGEASGTVLVLAGPAADLPLLATCLAQVTDATREAVQRLAARRAEDEQQVRDALLAEASLQMDAVLDSVQTMQRVARMAVPAIAEGCLVYVCEDEEPILRTAVHVDMRRLSGLRADPGAMAGLARLADEAIAGPPRRVGGAEAARFGTRTVDAQVLRARGRVIGVLIFMFDRDGTLIPEASFLRDLAQRAALAIDNGELYERRRREVTAMQQHLLPSRLPAVPGLTMAASYTVGDRVLEVGGDFYDAVVRGDGVVAALIGDVCGRGVDAAALTGMARHTLGTLLQEGLSPARALGRLNAGLRRDGSWRFVTAGVAMLRPAAGGVAVRWTSCGHPAPIVMRAGRPAEQGRGGGVLLGVLPQVRTGESRLLLAPGDTLVMFTDGLTESRDASGRMFEEAGLRAELERLRDAPVETLAHELSRTAATFGAPGTDDIAVLVIRAEEPDR